MAFSLLSWACSPLRGSWPIVVPSSRVHSSATLGAQRDDSGQTLRSAQGPEERGALSRQTQTVPAALYTVQQSGKNRTPHRVSNQYALMRGRATRCPPLRVPAHQKEIARP